ncbi:MAG: hypothetical protein KUG77_09355 [Nannocystaceae bacterium]|nr:hypothetical protein [Nannocystaceae bacterium]
MADFVRPWRSFLVGVLGLGVAAGVHGLFHAQGVPSRLPRPWLSAVPWVFALGGVAALLASTVSAVRRLTPWRRKLGASLLRLGLALGGLIGVFTSDPTFPFGPVHVASLALPDGGGTAYLYKGGVFCQQSVRLARPSQWWSEIDPERSGYTCEREGRLHWDDDLARVVVTDTNGEPLAMDTSLDGLGEALYWGPH